MDVEEFMNKHGELKNLDIDGSLKRNIESILKILNSSNHEGL
jgi:hypothetical protein